MSTGRVICAVLVAAALFDPASGQAPGAEPVLLIHLDSNGIRLSGAVSSPASAATLRELAGSVPGMEAARVELHEHAAAPPGWSLVAELTLRAMLSTRYSEANITTTRVSIRGVSESLQLGSGDIRRLRQALLPGMQLEVDIIETAAGARHEELCRRAFDAVLREHPVEFAPGSVAPGPEARVLLDALIELAVDCPTAHLTVFGAGDGPPSLAADRQLAAARAEAVVAYLSDRGIDRGRLTAQLATAAPAARSRRMSFAIRFGQAALP